MSHNGKVVSRDEADSLATRSVRWSDRCLLRDDQLPDAISGVLKMSGYVGTFFSVLAISQKRGYALKFSVWSCAQGWAG
jgi:hypothetical protein